MRLGTVDGFARYVRAPRTWLGSLAMADLLRVLPDTMTPDWLLVFVSVGAGLLPGVAAPITLCLFAVALYTFAPRFYPNRMGIPDDARGFRLLVTAIALAIGLVVAASEGVDDLRWGLAVGGLVFGLGVGGMLAYLATVHDWQLLDAKNPPVQPLAGLAREEYASIKDEISADLERDGPLGALGALFWLLALGFVIVIPATIAGFVANVLYNAYPLPEVLVLGWVAFGVIDPFIPSDRLPTRASLDPEERLYGTVKHATRTLKGMLITLFAICGLFGGAGYVLIGVQLLTEAPGPTTFRNTPIVAVALLAFVTAPLVAGGYLIWCWLRQFCRIRPFLDRWAGGNAPETAPPRAAGLTVPPTVLVLVVVTLLGGFSEHPLVPSIAATVISAGVLALFGVGLWTIRRPETPLGREGFAVTAGLVVQSVGLALAAKGEQLWIALVQRRGPLGLVDPQLIVFVTLVPAVALWPDIERYHARATGWRRYLRSTFACGFGVVFGTLGMLLSGGLSFALVGISAIAFFGGLALTATTYYDL